jgi:hypothetical protein
LFAAQINGGGSGRRCRRVPIASISVEDKYTRKRRQMRFAKGLDFLEKILTVKEVESQRIVQKFLNRMRNGVVTQAQLAASRSSARKPACWKWVS